MMLHNRLLQLNTSVASARSVLTREPHQRSQWSFPCNCFPDWILQLLSWLNPALPFNIATESREISSCNPALSLKLLSIRTERDDFMMEAKTWKARQRHEGTSRKQNKGKNLWLVRHKFLLEPGITAQIPGTYCSAVVSKHHPWNICFARKVHLPQLTDLQTGHKVATHFCLSSSSRHPLTKRLQLQQWQMHQLPAHTMAFLFPLAWQQDPTSTWVAR